jgi:gamma-glutamyltranspeptidase/glutathione hydrolase
VSAEPRRNTSDVRADPEARSIYLDASGNPWPLGHKLKNPAYAKTLRANCS